MKIAAKSAQPFRANDHREAFVVNKMLFALVEILSISFEESSQIIIKWKMFLAQYWQILLSRSKTFSRIFLVR